MAMDIAGDVVIPKKTSGIIFDMFFFIMDE